MSTRLFRLISLVVVVCSSIYSIAQSCGETVPQIRNDYFNKIGIGADYGPHYPCYTNGAVADCYDANGAPTGAKQDAKNYEFQASARLDMTQLMLSGFTAVRGYGFPAKVWIAMINRIDEINKASNTKLGVVYQVDACQSDAAVSGHPCINVPGSNFQQVVDFSETQLRQVIQQVTPAKFQRVVKLMIVGNEDLVISPTDNMTYNTQDLIGAINQTRTELTADGVTGAMDLSSATVIGQMSTTPGKTLAAAYPPGSPVIENVYGEQFANINTPAQALAFVKAEVVKMQSNYSDRPAMLGETGWWTAGTDQGYQNKTLVGTLTDAVSYYKLLYPYAKTCFVPTLIFEFYDEPTKTPIKGPNPLGQAEEHYGVFNPYNAVKDRSMLPKPVSQNFNADTSQAAIFTFAPAPGDASTAPPMTIGIQQPLETNPTKFTIQPFRQINPPPTGTTDIWPTFNLYVGSQAFLYRTVSGPVQCHNKVVTVYPNPPNGAAPYAGGVWQYQGVTAPGCPDFTDKAVNWADGQTVFLPMKFIITKP